MKKEQDIEYIFRDKLLDLDSSVDAKLWGQVAKKAGIQTGFWSFGKVASIFFVGLAGVLSIYFLTDTENNKKNTEIPVYQSEKAAKQETMEETLTVLAEQNSDVKGEEISPSLDLKKVKQKSSVYNGNSDLESKNEPIMEITSNTNNSEPSKTDFAQPLKEKLPTELVSSNVEEEVTANVFEAPAKFEEAPKLEIDILYAPEKKPELSRENIHLPGPYPKIFNPNLPGEAGMFSIPTYNIGYFKIQISNQRGQEVFTSMDPNFVWRGEMLNGSLAPEGNYIYIIEARDNEGVPLKPQSGAVFLMRK